MSTAISCNPCSTTIVLPSNLTILQDRKFPKIVANPIAMVPIDRFVKTKKSCDSHCATHQPNTLINLPTVNPLPWAITLHTAYAKLPYLPTARHTEALLDFTKFQPLCKTSNPWTDPVKKCYIPPQLPS